MIRQEREGCREWDDAGMVMFTVCFLFGVGNLSDAKQ